MRTTIDVRGRKLRTQTIRRYIVVVIAPLGAYIERRTDNLDTARTIARRYGTVVTGGKATRFAVIVDTTTGKEVT